MKKLFLALLFFLFVLPYFTAEAANPGNPTCVLMKFTDDTRYDKIGTSEKLSYLVLEKMVTSKRFNLKGTRPIDADMEARLYDEKVDELTAFDKAITTGDYNELFEGAGFRENKAQTIATAAVGQIITPEITSEIGRANNAEYLVQGTIINLGTGNWWLDDYALMSSALNMVSTLASASVANALGGALGPLGGMAAVDIEKSGIGVQCDMRIIKAMTGEVVWSKRVTGIGEQKLISIGWLTVGHANMSSRIYDKALDKAATKIVDALIADMDAGKLFVK